VALCNDVLDTVTVALDGEEMEFARLIASGGAMLFVARELWAKLMPRVTWTPLQRRVMALAGSVNANAGQMLLLKLNNVVPRPTVKTTLVTLDGAAAMLKGHTHLDAVPQQLAVVAADAQASGTTTATAIDLDAEVRGHTALQL